MGRRKKKGSTKFKKACERALEKGKRTGFTEGCAKRYPDLVEKVKKAKEK